jgi:SpoVK/Ycf46/Vps4 family AAA+-type ATPase
MGIPLKQLLEQALTKAKNYTHKHDYHKAAAQYELASELMFQWAEQASSRDTETKRKKMASQYKELARKLRSGEYIVEEKAKEEEKPEVTEADQIRTHVMELIRTANVTWNDIGGLEETKKEIKFAIGMSLVKPPIGIKMSAWSKMLFYGPPGTGKTLLAAATSRAIVTGGDAHATFFDVKISSVLSKYFGESSKIISELYGVARDLSPSVIFLDEFESISVRRDVIESGAERRILSTLLAELDGLEQKGREDIFVLTIAATNRPWDLDLAIVSRFERPIFIPLPDLQARIQILKIHLERKGYRCKFDYNWLAQLTEGFSGREIERLCKLAINKMIQEENRDLHLRVERGLEHVKNYQLKIRELTKQDFEYSRSFIQPLTKPDDMKRYLEWKKYVEGM